ncbi:zf-HC2 domain-containing protein [Streptomyces sp. DSM 44917]|uniref:Zf-HC2 domain-containing protein n=1 Tax=Streptomyces boetiae TaxID=3075541 RepID=A0ABU2L272_9ACTN|nr:zf-HC2 domain-containing protein [Streptomyces sp. DSM 44917]MDT0305363.1 zf-HC2 domain-containing protein [Streptomyces sp. DSM 44917]
MSPPEEAHQGLMALLGAWALAACSAAEAEAVEEHLSGCGSCAEEALRLRDAASLLEPRRGLDLDPTLRARVLEECLGRRPARLPLPPWAAPLDEEAARLDALLNDLTEEEWNAPVDPGPAPTPTGVLGRLRADDALLARALGLPDVEGENARETWREQTRALVRAAPQAHGRTLPETAYPPLAPPPGGEARLPVADVYLDRAFACWTHAADIARAVAYPYAPPQGSRLRLLVDLLARRLPGSLAASAPAPAEAGRPGRLLHLEVEGPGGGHWAVPVDAPAGPVGRAAPAGAVAHLVLEDVVLCQLAAGRISPEEAASGGTGDAAVLRDALLATAALARP